MVRLFSPVMIVALLAAGSPLSAADDPAALVQSLYGDRIARVTATPAKTDDIALAREILDAAAATKENLPALVALCEAAHELGMRHRDGYAVAASALELLCASEAPDIELHQMKLLDTYQKQIAVAGREEKVKLGETALTLLDDLSRQMLAKRNYAEATALTRRAQATAGLVNSPQRVADYKTKLAGLMEFERTQRRVTQLSERVLRDANDQPAMEEMVRLMIVDLDDPASANSYVPRLTEGEFKRLASLAIKPADELSTADRLSLGEWFHSLATQQKPSPAYAWLRAEEHLTAFLDGHTAADLQRTKATLKLKEVQQAITKGAADNIKDLSAPKVEPMIILSARFGGGNNWLDCTQRVKGLTFNNTLVLWAQPGWCGGDPTPGWRKKLHLRYRVGEKVVDRWFDEDARVFIYEGPDPRPTDELTILNASFGRADKSVDVTYHVKRSVRKNRLDITVIPREWNVPDPHPDRGDSLIIAYAVKGKVMLAHAGENGKIRIPAGD